MTISGLEVAAALERACQRLLTLRDQLNTLDAAIGDGDSGLTAEKGALGALEYLRSSPPGDDLGRWLIDLGAAYNRAAPSTMGALVATAQLRAGKLILAQPELTGELLAQMLLEADAGIQQRGKSKPGDKTIVDALHPAALAFAAAIEAGASLEAAGQAMLSAARAGRDEARLLRSKVGRAGWVGERTAGQLDPGTVLFVSALEVVLGIPASHQESR